MKTLFNRFVRDESGATAIEYGLIACLIAVMLVAVVPILSGGLSTAFTNIATLLGNTPTTPTN